MLGYFKNKLQQVSRWIKTPESNSPPLKEKEKFRFRLQRKLSDKRFVVLLCAITGIVLVILMVWAFNFVANCVSELAQGQIPAFSSFGRAFLMGFRGHASLMVCYLLIVVFAAIVAVRLGSRMIFAYEPLADTHNKGHQRWTTDEELGKLYRAIPAHSVDPDLSGPGGVPVARLKDDIFIDDDPVNNLILGMTRSGKGEILMFPIIDIFSRPKNIDERASMIFSDPKGELAAMAGDRLKERGYDVYIFSLKPPMDGMSYNPLELVKEAYLSYLRKSEQAKHATDENERRRLIRDADAESANAETYAHSLAYIINYDPNAKEKIWQDWGTAITTGAILAVVCDCCEKAMECHKEGEYEESDKWLSKITMYSVSRFIVDYCRPDPENEKMPPLLDQYIMHKTWSARYQYSPVNAADDRTKGNITAEALAKLTQLMLTPIAKLTSKNDLNFEDIGFGDKPVALFLVTPDSDHSNDFILSMFITQLYQSLCRRADREPGNRCKRQVRFELDEFGNIPPLPYMDSMITVCLGRNIRFDLIIQSYGQLYSQYGKDAARTIIENCGNQYYLKSNDPDTLKQFSTLIGNQTIASTSRFGDPLSLDKNLQESIDTRPLLDEGALKQFALGEIVVVPVMHTHDIHGNTVHPYPIFDYGETRMLPRYQYLADIFPSGKSFTDLNLADTCTHIDVNLEEIRYDPIADNLITAEGLKTAFLKNTGRAIQDNDPSNEQHKPSDSDAYVEKAKTDSKTQHPLLDSLSRNDAALFKGFCLGLSLPVLDKGIDKMTRKEIEDVLQAARDNGKILRQQFDSAINLLDRFAGQEQTKGKKEE